MHCDYHDIEAVEPDYFKSLKQILEFPLDMLGVELTFSAEIHTFGKIKVCCYMYKCIILALGIHTYIFRLYVLYYFAHIDL